MHGTRFPGILNDDIVGNRDGSCSEVASQTVKGAPVPGWQFTQAGRRCLEGAILATLAIVMIAQLWTSVVQLSVTSDEADHLHAAYRYWQCKDFGWNPEHPPLVKFVAGLPLQFMHVEDPFPQACGAENTKIDDFMVGRQFIFSNPESMLTRARLAVSFFSILLLVSVWFFARKMFDLPVAIIAGVLVAFEPNILAHGALVTTDIAATVGFLLSLYALYCYVEKPSATRILSLGLALGLALSVKHSAILLAVIVPALVLADVFLAGRPYVARQLLKYAGSLIVAALVAFAVLWGCYGFRYVARPNGARVWTPLRAELSHGTLANKVIPELKRARIAPEAYLVGLHDVLINSELGRSTFLLGKHYETGRWFYFPISAAIKFTLPLILMLLASALALRFWRTKRRQLLYLGLPILIYLIFGMTSKLNSGIRYFLPILPLLIIFASAGSWGLVCDRRRAMLALGALLVLHSASSLHAHPNYLSYANEAWGGPAEVYKYLPDSDVDWGQAQKMARAYIDKTHPENCFFLRTFINKNSDYGIRCGGVSDIQEDELQTPYTGTIIVGSSLMNGIGRYGDLGTRRTFAGLKPTAKLGGSALLVYEGTFDLSPIVAAQLLVRARGEQSPQAALALAQRASTLDPLSGYAHAVMCRGYVKMGLIGKAEEECNVALSLIRQDPRYGPEQVKYVEEFMSGKGLRIYSATDAH